MRKYEVIAFDLDGTLTNPERGLMASFKYAHQKMGIAYESENALRRFIGPSLYDEWQRCYGISAEKASEMLLVFREFFSVYGWWDNEVYKGIPELLCDLKNAGYRLVVATSKPEHFAKKIIRKFDIEKYFEFIGGASSDKTRDKKHEVLEYVLESIGWPDRKRVIIVGDRKYDAEGAAAVGIDSLGVAWGFGSDAELKKSGFTAVAAGVDDVRKFFIN